MKKKQLYACHRIVIGVRASIFVSTESESMPLLARVCARANIYVILIRVALIEQIPLPVEVQNQHIARSSLPPSLQFHKINSLQNGRCLKQKFTIFDD